MARRSARSAARQEFRARRFTISAKKYAGLMPSEMKRLRQLEEENAKLKRIVPDLSLDEAMLQDVLSKTL